MKRRDALKLTTTAASVALFTPRLFGNKNQWISQFKLDYAPHFGMFSKSAPNGLIDELEFLHNEGFRSLEDNEMRNRPLEEQKAIAQKMSSLNLRMGVFVAHTIYWNKPTLTSNDLSWRKQFLEEIKSSIDVAKRVNAKWMTVVPGHLDLSLDLGYQTSNVVETLKQACQLLESHGLIMVLEPLNKRDHPGLFLTKASQAYEICKAVDSPSCKILFDIYHQQITEGNLIPNIEACWDEIAYFQIGDNPGRNEPYSGEINYQNVFKFIHDKGFDGILGMEHGNSMKGIEGERKVVELYRKADSF